MLIMIGVGGYLMVPPMLHHERRRFGPMVLSGSLRLALPLGALAITRERDVPGRWQAAAMVGGAAAAMVLDWALLSNDRGVAPVVTPTGDGDGVALGISGAF